MASLGAAGADGAFGAAGRLGAAALVLAGPAAFFFGPALGLTVFTTDATLGFGPRRGAALPTTIVAAEFGTALACRLRVDVVSAGTAGVALPTTDGGGPFSADTGALALRPAVWAVLARCVVPAAAFGLDLDFVFRWAAASPLWVGVSAMHLLHAF